jgi:hypothetical protein
MTHHLGPRSYFSKFEHEGVLCLIDHNGPRSLTNDMERVIEDLALSGTNVDRPIVYRDSEGIWDGVVTEDCRFDRFIGLGSRTPDEAIRKLLTPTTRPKAA